MPKKARTDEESIAAFHSNCKINEESSKKCLEWTRGLVKGYGKFCWQGKDVGAHRLAYELHHGRQIAEGMMLLHSCDNPKCVTPAHLSEGTNQDNSDDKVSKGRQSKGESHVNSKLTALQVVAIREKVKTCTQRKLAKEYGVSDETISKIIRNEHWKI